MTFLFFKTERYLQNLIREALHSRRTRQIRKILLIAGLAVLCILMFSAATFSGMATLSSIKAQSKSISSEAYADLPASIIQDARIVAYKAYGNSQQAEAYYKELILAYRESINQDFMVLFNSGGWGTKMLQDSPGWSSIIDGLQNVLVDSGYNVITLNYQRTTDSLRGKLNEFREICTGYIDKSNELAQCVEFITRHNPDVTVILAGESTGTLICDRAMNILQDNERAFSIQTGSPFWYQGKLGERTLSINDNGLVPDSFSRGDAWTMLKNIFGKLIGVSKIESNGAIFGSLPAPGHEYWWDNPGVCTRIEGFLSKYFGLQIELQTTR